jgi:PAS domain S-box-containing protein
VTQNEVEVILLRHLASYLAMPVFVADNDGEVIYFNEAAEKIIGRQFEETDTLPLAERFQAFRPVNEDGKPISANEMPMAVALREQRPVHRRFRLHGFDGSEHDIEATAFPLIGQAGRKLGVVALFWERSA